MAAGPEGNGRARIQDAARKSRHGTAAVLTGVAETAMLTLWARARETQRHQPLVTDHMAVAWSERLDYDFTRFDDSWKSLTSIAIRTWILDREISAQLTRQPRSVVLNLGAGFDNRFWRMDNGAILWYDIDLPAVVATKKTLVNETDRYHMIGRSILDFTWLDEIETGSRPMTIIAEGVLMYLEESEINTLLRVLARTCPGADMFLELLAPAMVNRKYHDSSNTLDAGFKWSLLNGRDLAAMHAKLKFIDEWCVLDYFRERWDWIGHYADYPMVRNYFGEKIVHIRFR